MIPCYPYPKPELTPRYIEFVSRCESRLINRPTPPTRNVDDGITIVLVGFVGSTDMPALLRMKSSTRIYRTIKEFALAPPFVPIRRTFSGPNPNP